MANWGSCEFGDIEKLQQNIRKMNTDAFLKSLTKKIAEIFLKKVIAKTPKESGKLQRGWVSNSEAQAEQSFEINVAQHVLNLVVKKNENKYSIEISNPVSYAKDIEVGFRMGNRFVEGEHMLTKTEQEIRNETPAILQREIETWLRRVFG